LSAEPIADAELVARSRRHDAGAFGVLVERHQRLVFGVALARCQDPSLAEDLAQEAFVTAWRDLDRLRDVDRVGPWVAGIARNLASSASRDRARRQPDSLVPPPALAEVPTPEDEVLEREDRELLRRALADVPEAHREALVRYYLEGESIAAIAEALGIREDLVKQRLSRGRRALRDSVAARVESALTRARAGGRGRGRSGIRLGVLAAITSFGARDASAAGKAIAVMSVKKVVVAAAVAAVLGTGAVWIGTRADARESEPAARPESKLAAEPAPAAAPPRPRVRKADSPAAQAALRASIQRRAEQRRRAAPPSMPADPAARSSSAPAPTMPRGEQMTGYIQAAVRDIVPLLSECYREGLARRPDLGGDVMVDFKIEGEPDVGAVISSSKIVPEKSSIQDPVVLECIQETMYALQLDPPAEGDSVRVVYRFAFSPGEPSREPPSPPGGAGESVTENVIGPPSR
jgi:RNA polymerase sigma factor (sigma-70 family)